MVGKVTSLLKRRNECNKNLDATFATIVIITAIISQVAMFTIENMVVLLSIVIPLTIIQLITEVWYLHQKGRSLGFLLLNILSWIGFLILLGLENRRNLSPSPEDKVMI